MKKYLLILIGISACAALAYWVYLASASDDTRIRWLVADMLEGFNDSRAGRVVSGLSEDFSEDTVHVSREEIKGFLLQLFLTERDPETKEFRFKAEISDLQISVKGGDPPKASARLTATLLQKSGAQWASAWVVDVEAGLGKEDGDWKFFRSRHTSREGRRPF